MMVCSQQPPRMPALPLLSSPATESDRGCLSARDTRETADRGQLFPHIALQDDSYSYRCLSCKQTDRTGKADEPGKRTSAQLLPGAEKTRAVTNSEARPGAKNKQMGTTAGNHV
jgi:hypothetical protein